MPGTAKPATVCCYEEICLLDVPDGMRFQFITALIGICFRREMQLERRLTAPEFHNLRSRSGGLIVPTDAVAAVEKGCGYVVIETFAEYLDYPR